MNRDAGTPRDLGEVGETAPAVQPLPPELATEIRRLLAEALVRDYLSDNGEVGGGHGEHAVGDAIPTSEGAR